MQLNDKDIELFRALQESNVGKRLVDYLERVKTEWADVRTMVPGENVESRKAVLSLLDNDLVDRIKLGGQKKSKEPITTFE